MLDVLGAIVFLGLAAFLVSLDLYPINRLENAALDLRFRERGVRSQSDIVVVGVDDSTLAMGEFSAEELGGHPALNIMMEQFPWNREIWAILLDRLFDSGARMVLLDFFFDSSKEGDDVLEAAIKKYQDRLVLGSYFYSSGGGEEGAQRVSYQEPVEKLIPFTGEEILGYVNIDPDRDGTVRRMRHATRLVSELAGLMEENSVGSGGENSGGTPQWLMEEPPIISLSGVAYMKLNGQLENAVPASWFKHRLIDFSGPRNWFSTIPIEQIFIQSDWENRFQNGAYFKDKIIIVGPLASVFQDFKSTPMGALVPGPEIHANMLASLLDNRGLRELGFRWELGIAVLLTVLMTLGATWLTSMFQKQLLLAFLIISYLIGSQFAFDEYFAAMPVFLPLFSLMGIGVFSLSVDFIVERYERQRLRGVLDRYVSPNVASVIIRQDRDAFEVALKGEKRPVVILFSDIRGFTSWSEKLDPILLVEQLNEYFSVMVQAILDRGGTLQKYIGDALMAVWGDTHTVGVEKDVAQALRAVLQMQRQLILQNEKWANREDRSQLSFGIGLNFGEAVVGNLGHPQRMEFTVLGDAVNFAARLESATKQFKQSLLVSESVQKLAGDRFIFRIIDRLKVKGKSEPIEVFTLLGERGNDPEPEWLQTYHEAIKIFRERQFEQAETVFQALVDGPLKDDFMCQHFLSRCRDGKQLSPHDTWEPAYELKDK